MAAQRSSKQKQKTKIQQKKQPRFGDTMMDEVILIIIVVVSFVVLISLLTKKMGILGGLLGESLKSLLGVSSILLPLTIVAYCCWLLASEEKENREVRIAGAALFLISISALAHVIHPIEVSVMSSLADTLKSYYQEGAFNNGGFVGGILGGGLARAFGKIGSGIIWSAVLLISLIMATGKSFFKGVSNVNAYQKNKRRYYQEKKQKNDEIRQRETYIQEVPKKTVRPPKIQQKPQPRLQSKQSIKKKQHKKSDFNIMLHADEGYNGIKQEVPLVETTVFKSKAEQETLLEPMPKTPVIFDYGKTESQIMEEQQEVLYNTTENVLQKQTSETKAEKSDEQQPVHSQEIQPDIKKDAIEQKQEQTTEKIQQNITTQMPEEEAKSNIRYMIFQEGEEPLLEEEAEEVPSEIYSEQVQQKPQETFKSDTDDITDVLELLNRIEFEEEGSESTSEQTISQEDIMDIIADWAEEEEEDIPESNGLTLLFAEEENTQLPQYDSLEESQQQYEQDFKQQCDFLEEEEQTQQYDFLEKEEQIQQYDSLEKEENQQQYVLEEKPQQQFDSSSEEETKEKDTAWEIQQPLHQEMNSQQTEEEVEQPEYKSDVQYEEQELIQQNKKPSPVIKQQKPYIFPPLDLLAKNQAVQSNDSKAEMLVNAKKLENTLRSFGVEAKVIQINKGPTVTRYELSPSQGVKVSKIVNLADDIALNLAASDIRIEAPIPGKAAVGIEVPNKEAQSVFLRSVLESEAFQKFPSKLAFALGEDIAGQPIVADIAKMPHLLIAGATGSGKSVCINTLITSILYKADPKEVKLLLVDPKVVELSVYNGIPHLLIPVVTDPKKASAALNWAVREMLERYNDFAENGVRDIKGYNAMKKEQGETENIMPQIVIIIDELADLMMAAPGEVEDAICRLAQMARAAGMHLIIATQRPSVDVITGVIKANIPSRLAFAVSSGIDSRTILDAVGAEKLLGKGDMLFCPQGTSKPMRIQGAFLSDKEVESIVNFIKQDTTTDYDKEMIDKITATAKINGGGEEVDEFFDQAVDLVVEKEKASVSMLQRQFRIGYNRAARLMDSLQQQGIVGPEEGSKPRKVLLTKQEWADMRGYEQ